MAYIRAACWGSLAMRAAPQRDVSLSEVIIKEVNQDPGKYMKEYIYT
jgi:hypothetical protein